MKEVQIDDLSVIHIQEAPALYAVLPALSYKEAPRCLEHRSEVVQLKDCILFAWRPDRLRRAYEALDRGTPTGELMRVVEYRVGEARYYVPTPICTTPWPSIGAAEPYSASSRGARMISRPGRSLSKMSGCSGSYVTTGPRGSRCGATMPGWFPRFAPWVSGGSPTENAGAAPGN